VRDAALFGSADRAERRYRRRYIPAQRLYGAEARPLECADLVVHTDDPERPLLERGGRCHGIVGEPGGATGG